MMAKYLVIVIVIALIAGIFLYWANPTRTSVTSVPSSPYISNSHVVVLQPSMATDRMMIVNQIKIKRNFTNFFRE
jgi:hypothetical protein